MTEEMHAIEEKRYPIGQFEWGKEYSGEDIEKMIDTIEKFPARLKMLVLGMNEEQLETNYRDGGWNVRQVVHHVADSHMNAYIRFKLALTEDKPTIKPYNEKAWAEMIDSKTLPLAVSLGILDGIHKRWSTMLRAMDQETFQRTFFHPEHMRMHNLTEILAMYAWHCNHHYEHINLVKKQFPSKPKAAKKKSEPAKTTAKLPAAKKSKAKSKA